MSSATAFDAASEAGRGEGAQIGTAGTPHHAPGAEGPTDEAGQRLPGAQRQSPLEDKPEPPSRRFRDEEPGRTETPAEAPAPPVPPPVFPVSGDAILQSIRPAEQAPVAPAAPASTETRVAALAEQVAERILVSDPSQAGQREVRVLLKDDVLPQTEVRISRQDGEVRIEFVTQSSDSYALLAEHQSDLQSRLSQRLDQQPVTVALTHSGSDASREQGQPDGRSRNRRDLYDELQDNQSRG